MMTKLIFVLIVILSGIYSLVLNIVKHRSANNPTPENVSDVYDAETYAKWKKYSAEHCKLDLISGIISTVITAVLLFTEVYALFASIFPQNFFMQIFAVILLDTAVGSIVSIIVSYFETMVIEEKYGFNRSTVKTFVADKIRSVILNLCLSLAIAMLIAGCYEWLGVFMVVAFVVAVFLFTMVVSFLYPILSRVGNKFTPLEEGELKDRLMELLTKHGYQVKAIEVMDASRRTTKLNAYFTGFGKLKTIVLYDNLVNAMSTDEICAVFAHELGHGLNKDVLKQQALNIVYMALIGCAALLTVELPVLHTDFGFEGINYGFAYILVGVLLSLIQPLISLIINANSRRAEYRADYQAVLEGYGEATVSAFKKLAKDNFAHLAPSKINVVLEYSHPPLSSRIEAVEKAMKEMEK